ncbi:MAG: glycosyltransferase family 1 protein, partial [Anaerolineales bacterium]
RLKCASVVTIHDMIWYSPIINSMRAPGSLKRKLMNGYYSLVPRLAARKASLILTVSEASKDRITQMLGIPTEKVIVTYEAANPIFRLVDDVEQIGAVRDKYSLHSNYILALGSADPRKNISTLIQAYAQLPANLKAAYHLVIVWNHMLMAEKLMGLVNDLELSEYVSFITHVSKEDLVLLYNAASLFVFPSLDEGFGLPPLEAMACGTPVVAADNSSIPEIVGDAALLVKAEDALNMARGIKKILSNENLKTELVCNGTQRVASFSWENCASQTLIAFEKVL